jgi:AcrR family transcriptional regulator
MPDSDRSYPSVWARPRRKERTTLTREQIVAEALRLLDTEGIEALSMRRLASSLGVGATSLYWHVTNRDELIELIIDEVFGELDVPDPASGEDWRTATREFAESLRAIVLRHRWLVSVLDYLVAAYLGPNFSNATERMLIVLEAGGFPLADADRALNTVSAFVIGSAMSEAAWHNWLQRRGQTEQDWMDNAMQVAEETTEGLDRMRSLVDNYRTVDPREALDADFTYGLDRVLDGLALSLAGPTPDR